MKLTIANKLSLEAQQLISRAVDARDNYRHALEIGSKPPIVAKYHSQLVIAKTLLFDYLNCKELSLL